MNQLFWDFDHEETPAASIPKRTITVQIKRVATLQTEIVISVALGTESNGHLNHNSVSHMEVIFERHDIDFDSAIQIIEETSEFVASTIPELDDPTGSDLNVIVKIYDHNINAVNRIDLDEYTMELRETRREPNPIEADDICTVCHEVIGAEGEINSLECEHTYHHDCIMNLVMNRLTCPCCRAPLA